MKAKFKSRRNKNKTLQKSKKTLICEKSFIKNERNRTIINKQRKYFLNIRNNIIVSDNFNLMYFENEYFDDIEKYLTNQRS